MDIQVASNFERLLYYFLDGNTSRLVEVMSKFREQGKYSFDEFSIKGFSSVSAQDSEIPELIKMVKDKFGYLLIRTRHVLSRILILKNRQ